MMAPQAAQTSPAQPRTEWWRLSFTAVGSHEFATTAISHRCDKVSRSGDNSNPLKALASSLRNDPPPGEKHVACPTARETCIRVHALAHGLRSRERRGASVKLRCQPAPPVARLPMLCGSSSTMQSGRAGSTVIESSQSGQLGRCPQNPAVPSGPQRLEGDRPRRRWSRHVDHRVPTSPVAEKICRRNSRTLGNPLRHARWAGSHLLGRRGCQSTVGRACAARRKKVGPREVELNV